MKLTDTLHELWEKGNFPTSWLIESKNLNETFLEVTSFIQNAIKSNDLPSSTDFKVISSEKTISVSQIRELNSFALSRPNCIANFAVIEANKMNINGFNALLKLLEDASCFMILLCENIHSIPLTVRSRCYKFKDLNHARSNYSDNVRTFLSSQANVDFTQERVIELIESKIELLCRLIKYRNGLRIKLSLEELLIFDKIKSEDMMAIFDSLVSVKRDLKKYKLDPKHCYLQCFRLIS